MSPLQKWFKEKLSSHRDGGNLIWWYSVAWSISSYPPFPCSHWLWPQPVRADFCEQGELLFPLLSPVMWAMWWGDAHDLYTQGLWHWSGTTALFILLITTNKGQVISWKYCQPQDLISLNLIFLTLFDDRSSINTIINGEIQPPMLELADVHRSFCYTGIFQIMLWWLRTF